MHPSVQRVIGRSIHRRRLLLAAPAALLPLSQPATGDRVVGPVAETAAALRARAGVVAADLHYAMTSPARERLGRALLDVLGDAEATVAVSLLDRRTGVRWHHRGECRCRWRARPRSSSWRQRCATPASAVAP